MNVAFCASEVFPFAKTGGLADVCGTLPLALEKKGLKVKIFLPLYACVRQGPWALRDLGHGVWMSGIGQAIEVYFIEHHDFFHRPGLYGENGETYDDNLERFQFFCQRTLEVLGGMSWPVDILHCHDWQTALMPVYLKEIYAGQEVYQGTKSVLTIHNLAFQGVFPSRKYAKLHLRKDLFSTDGFEFFHQINLLKAGLIFSDEITTVSPTYAREIQTKEFGCGLEGVLRARQERVVGILNGLDYETWNPKKDPFLSVRYDQKTWARGKAANKEAVQRRFDLPVSARVPLFGFVGRLSQQKGIDLILAAIDELVLLDIQVIIQGVGEEKYHALLSELAYRYPDKVKVSLVFNEAVAHQIYAGSDFFLMPSQFEPCGLSQMISLCYGTIPIVSATGGLVDTIQDARKETTKGNGFVLPAKTKKGLLEAVNRALAVYADSTRFQALVQRAFGARFSWDRSAEDYCKVYQGLQQEAREAACQA